MQTLANLVAIFHLAYFAFVVLGFFGIVIGAFRHWGWVRNSWFRVLHMAAIYIVLAEDVIGLMCPLNVAESDLRKSAAEPVSGVGHVLDQLLHHTIYGRTLDIIYVSLGIGALALLFLVPPDFMRRTPRR